MCIRDRRRVHGELCLRFCERSIFSKKLILAGQSQQQSTLLMNDYDSDEERKKNDLKLPPYTVRFCEMPLKILKEIVINADECTKASELDKDIALEICRKCRLSKNLEIGDGEWQCIIGKNFASSLNYNTKMIAFFDLPNHGRTYLIFKSGQKRPNNNVFN
eukprot:TRINITY_DN7923_c0_g1_i2.p1 TRINITY_DN7923_c0_g1~~TRINITY_DN7923_c0_g1_i2.p1  ORF type:complete len:161 (+),score=34.11 TRINITY_DN7923_c0_g1_i2:65-547(+)